MDEDRHAVAEHLDRPGDLLGERLERLEAQARSLRRDESIDLLGRAVQRDVRRATPSPYVARIVADELSCPGRDRAIERAVIAEVDRPVDARGVQQELGRAPERADVAAGWTK